MVNCGLFGCRFACWWRGLVVVILCLRVICGVDLYVVAWFGLGLSFELVVCGVLVVLFDCSGFRLMIC